MHVKEKYKNIKIPPQLKLLPPNTAPERLCDITYMSPVHCWQCWVGHECADQSEQTRVIREMAVSLKRQELKTAFQTGGAAGHKK